MQQGVLSSDSPEPGHSAATASGFLPVDLFIQRESAQLDSV